MAYTNLQVKNTDGFCSVQYRKALPKHLITVHEEWWKVKTLGKEEGKQEVPVANDITYIRIILHKISYKSSLKKWDLIIQKMEVT